MDTSDAPLTASHGDVTDVHQKIGHLTRQLHNALNELGYTEKLRGTMGELPDAKSRLSYIARLTGEAAEKVLTRVEQAKTEQDALASDTQEVRAALIKDPVRAVASGRVLNYLSDVEQRTRAADTHLTEIMMAQDFHDLTGQVIARVVNLAATIEEQLVQLVIQTAPVPVAVAPTVTAREHLAGPVVDPDNTPDIVTDQSQVDDLLASLGF
ncbi:protein phosphatase CheZ [Curvibacter sp. RS43]|jgi:chemotaxis protein CheZ|uniref:protein phosphatase CheZ n=1 Tax=Curvibacter microcysteis TaxID=3026419 RepID=UPI0023614CF6|nr:protein phosphatase CheZ [Curvibacter sp. RS43]MDD0811800.1 protein phosphatase CheZ [Curvibacter sp. RS43]